MKRKPLVSIIILNWNTSDDTIECIFSLNKQTLNNFEIIIVDNASSEKEFSKLEKIRQPNIRVFRNKENKGFCEGNNIGFEVSNGKYAVFLNNDTVLDKNWLKSLLEPFDDESVGATASKILFYNNRDLIQYAGGRLTFYGRPIMESALKRNNNDLIIRETGWFHGASFAIRRDIAEKLKEVFPKNFFIFFEEIDLSWRIKTLGYKIIFNPESVVYHKHGASVKGKLKVKKMYIRNKYFTFRRNLSTPFFLSLFPSLVFYDIIKSLVDLILLRGPGYFVSFITGFLEFMRCFRRTKTYKSGNLSYLSIR